MPTEHKFISDNCEISSRIDILFKEYYPRLCAYAARFVGGDISKDLVMDCFVKLWEKKDKISNDALHSMLFVMVRNACLNHLKRQSIINFENLDYLNNLEGEERMYNFDFDLGIEKKLLYEELHSMMNETLNKLPDKCREVFVKSRFEGKKNKEIAQETNTSVRNVEKHIANALRVFSKLYKGKFSI